MSKKLFGTVAVVALVVGGAAGRLSSTPQMNGLRASLAQAVHDRSYLCNTAYTWHKIIDGCEGVYLEHIGEGGPGSLITFVSEVRNMPPDTAFVKGGNTYAKYPSRASFLASVGGGKGDTAYATDGGVEPSLGAFVDQQDTGSDGPKVIAPASGPDGVLPGPKYDGDEGGSDDDGGKEEDSSSVGLLGRWMGGGDGLPPKGKTSVKKPAS